MTLAATSSTRPSTRMRSRIEAREFSSSGLKIRASRSRINCRRAVRYSDGELIGSSSTDDNGVATVALPPGHRGANRTYEAVFEGDDYYLDGAAERKGKGQGGNGGGGGNGGASS